MEKLKYLFMQTILFAYLKIKEMLTDLQSFGKKIGKFSLTLSNEKTNIIDFRTDSRNSIDFLGFTLRWGKDKRRTLKIRTSKRSLRNHMKR